MNKSWFYYPIIAATFGTGSYLYDKLKAHYLNPYFDYDILHHWHIDYEKKYNCKNQNPQNWEKDLELTEVERMNREWDQQMSGQNIHGQKVFKRMGKDKNDFFYMYSKIRNLENIVFLSEEDLEGITNPIELQIKIDSVTPKLTTSKTKNEDMQKFFKWITDYKMEVENMDHFRSIKDKLLGMPFLMYRMRQHPEPYRGTWQYDLFTKIFGYEYDMGKNDHETEEKINKYNYHQHLHPSVIAKYDTNSEDFEMLLRKMNYEHKTTLEAMRDNREYYCKNVLPLINLCEPKLGEDIAHYVLNKKSDNEDYSIYLHNQYSNVKEEQLFREVEEANFLNKNKPLVNRLYYKNINRDSVGMKASEFDEIMKNPTKAKKMRKALETKYQHYDPASYLDKLRFAARKAGYLDTMIENQVDVRDPEFNMLDVFVQQYGYRLATDEEEVAKAHHINYPQYGYDNNTYNHDQLDVQNYFTYNQNIDWSDYCYDFPGEGLVSPKINRMELHNKSLQKMYDQFFFRFYNNPRYENLTGYIRPYKDINNEDLLERIPTRTEFLKYVDRQHFKSTDKQITEFLEDTTERESFAPSDDPTEEELDQAIFEASYSKPVHESDEYKSRKIFYFLFKIFFICLISFAFFIFYFSSLLILLIYHF